MFSASLRRWNTKKPASQAQIPMLLICSGCTTSRKRDLRALFCSRKKIDKSPRLKTFPSSFVNFILTFAVIPLSIRSLTKKQDFHRCRLALEHETISIERFRKFWHCRPCFCDPNELNENDIRNWAVGEGNETLNLNWNFMKCSTPIPHLRRATPQTEALQVAWELIFKRF